MEPGELREAKAVWDAKMEKADKRRMWIEERAKQLFEDGIDYRGMAWEVDASAILGRVMTIWYSGRNENGIFKASATMNELLNTEVLKYCFELAEQEYDRR